MFFPCRLDVNKRLLSLKLQHTHHLEDLRNAWTDAVRACSEEIEGDECDSASIEKSSSVVSDEYPSSTGWESKSEDKDSEHGAKVKKSKQRVPRTSHSCPLKGCKSKVIHLPRHLRDVHKWTKEKARKATSRFGLRKSFLPKFSEKKVEQSPKKTVQEKKRKDYHRHRRCPVNGCSSVVKRLSNHIQQVHKDIKKGSPVYKQLLREARSFKTWQSSQTARDKPIIKGESSFSNLTEEESVEEGSVQELPTLGAYENEDNEEHEAGNEETEELQEDKEQVEILKSFCQWLQTADGGRRDKKMAKQHCSQLRKILSIIDPEGRMSSLLNKSLVRDRFLRDYAEKKYKPDTVKSHLLSLRNFCSFVLTENPECIQVNPVIVQKVAEKARLWSSSYRKDSNRRHLEKQNEDLEKLVTPSLVSTFENSESTRKAVAYIGQLSGAHSLEVNQSIYTLIRDFILTEITIANAHRSGVLANMTIGEFEKAKETEQGSVVIKVSQHKTADTHGPASVVLSPTLFTYLKVYVSEVRRQVSKSNDDKSLPVFLSWSGAKLESGQISTAINAAWKKAGLEGHVSSTIFRKSTVTKVHKDHEAMKDDLADLMGHKRTTAERFYRIRQKEEACVEAANNLASIMRIPKKVPVPEHEKSAITNDKDSLPESSRKERLSWKEEEVSALKELFADDIRKKSITLVAVRDKISEHPTLQHLDPKRVCDKVRSEWRFKDHKDHEEEDTSDNPSCKPPEQTENLSDKMSRFFESSAADKSTDSSSDVVLPSNPSYLSRNIFSDDDRKFLLRVCGVMVRGGVISKPQIKKLLENENEGKELLRKYTIEQLVNRLKYERRLNNRQSRS